jgi:hypothetical protein
MVLVDGKSQPKFKFFNSHKIAIEPIWAYFWSSNFLRVSMIIFSIAESVLWGTLLGALDCELAQSFSLVRKRSSHLYSHRFDRPSSSHISPAFSPAKYRLTASLRLSVSSIQPLLNVNVGKRKEENMHVSAAWQGYVTERSGVGYFVHLLNDVVSEIY